MATGLPDKDQILKAIRDAAKTLGRAPSRAQFFSVSGVSQRQMLKHFTSWREAVLAAGLEPNLSNLRLDPSVLLQDWGEMVRRERRIPTVNQYQRAGRYSPDSFEKNFGAWRNIPGRFKAFVESRTEWADVVALIPTEVNQPSPSIPQPGTTADASSAIEVTQRHGKLDSRPTYGNPIDFRGLRHEPVNEQGVVFLFGMVARELGYLVEAMQAGYPDCEAKRQVEAGKWQRVRIEFEYESRNFRDHGHPPDGCDIIVCWRHNWPECPSNLEVVELSRVIKTLAADEA
ncbi:MAG: hypothetical protein ABSE73_27530 [Planctomycetota bacterium]